MRTIGSRCDMAGTTPLSILVRPPATSIGCCADEATAADSAAAGAAVSECVFSLDVGRKDTQNLISPERRAAVPNPLGPGVSN